MFHYRQPCQPMSQAYCIGLSHLLRIPVPLVFTPIIALLILVLNPTHISSKLAIKANPEPIQLHFPLMKTENSYVVVNMLILRG